MLRSWGWLLPLPIATLACVTLLPPHPALEWNPDPAAVVVRAYDSGGLVPRAFALNNLPAATVFGDGRLVWVEYLGNGARRVQVAQLAAHDLTAFLQEASDAGFFGWAGFYGDMNVYDASTQCLEITLTNTTQTVCEYVSGAPAKFNVLYNAVGAGLGQTGQDFVPTQAWLVATPISPSTTGGSPPFVWPSTALGFSLAEAGGGRWVEGEALALAWRVVNGNVWGNTVTDGANAYELTLQIAGLSLSPPPAGP